MGLCGSNWLELPRKVLVNGIPELRSGESIKATSR